MTVHEPIYFFTQSRKAFAKSAKKIFGCWAFLCSFA
jgi:hypothetical protein